MSEGMDQAMIAGLQEDAELDRAEVAAWDETLPAIDAVFGRSGEQAQCRIFTDEMSVHWFPTAGTPGTPCLCGATTMLPDREDGAGE